VEVVQEVVAAVDLVACVVMAFPERLTQAVVAGDRLVHSVADQAVLVALV
jgi:hypothetical protein